MIRSNIQPVELAFDKSRESTEERTGAPEVLTLSAELNRLLVAAVVSRRFCRLLLTNPAAALAGGYRGQPFNLTAVERNRILAISAPSLPDFARQLTRVVDIEPTQPQRKQALAVGRELANRWRRKR